ncbi:MAG: hypothetical protein DRH21_00640 [Deltaproteobacteria bacterium]|nr:MAG: hypothetical protein DRH21_00640 [Deltaproteobacteria bacterium]
MITDTTFFTNEPGYALLDRFKKTLEHVKYFDVVGKAAIIKQTSEPVVFENKKLDWGSLKIVFCLIM